MRRSEIVELMLLLDTEIGGKTTLETSGEDPKYARNECKLKATLNLRTCKSASVYK
jgi:hypothetical protein